MLDKIIQWAEKEVTIQALILVGSRASGQYVDTFSDYDLSVFCDNDFPHTTSEEWLSQFGNVWICINETIACCGNKFPSRLVIFEGGVKVDFSFLSTVTLDHIIRHTSLPEMYNQSYKVLLDKKNITQRMTSENIEPMIIAPTEKEFHRILKEFWFEIYHVGISLKRQDLWSVKFRSWSAYTFLLKLIEWHTKTNLPAHGKWMNRWINKDLWEQLYGIFAHFDPEDSWNALFNVMKLFKQLSAEIAETLGYSKLEHLSNQMIGFITKLRSDS